MKKSLCILLVLVLLCTPILLVACDNDVEDDIPVAVEMHKVTIRVQNVNKVIEFEIEDGGIIGDFTTYTDSFYTLVALYNYYTDWSCTKEWDLFRDRVYTDMTLYGKFAATM